MTRALKRHTVDMHALPVMLGTLRLPSFQHHWPKFSKIDIPRLLES